MRYCVFDPADWERHVVVEALDETEARAEYRRRNDIDLSSEGMTSVRCTPVVPVGTRVRYHGSVPHTHRVYKVEDYCDLNERKDLTSEQIAEGWPDGVSYELWPVGVLKKFGNRDQAIYFVRRKSFTVIEA